MSSRLQLFAQIAADAYGSSIPRRLMAATRAPVGVTNDGCRIPANLCGAMATVS